MIFNISLININKKDYVRHIIGCAGYLGRYRAGKGISAEGGSRVQEKRFEGEHH